MLASMSLRTLNEWRAYSEVEPFGEERADVRAAIIAATVANASRTKRGQRAFKIGDFMPEYGRKTARQTPEEMKAVLQQSVGAFHAARKNRGAK